MTKVITVAVIVVLFFMFGLSFRQAAVERCPPNGEVGMFNECLVR